MGELTAFDHVAAPLSYTVNAGPKPTGVLCILTPKRNALRSRLELWFKCETRFWESKFVSDPTSRCEAYECSSRIPTALQLDSIAKQRRLFGFGVATVLHRSDERA